MESCGMSCIKYLLFIFNFLFAVSALSISLCLPLLLFFCSLVLCLLSFESPACPARAFSRFAYRFVIDCTLGHPCPIRGGLFLSLSVRVTHVLPPSFLSSSPILCTVRSPGKDSRPDRRLRWGQPPSLSLSLLGNLMMNMNRRNVINSGPCLIFRLSALEAPKLKPINIYI